MSYCISCGSKVEQFKEDGKGRDRRRLRKHCLSCVPFGLTKKKEMSGDCTCTICGRNYTYDRKKGHGLSKCGSCTSSLRRFEIKKRAIDYKGGKCQVCGYSRCLRALKFHHLDPTKKEFGIAGNHCFVWSRLVIELDKCVLICGNCHDEIHDGLVDLSSFVGR